MVYLQLVAFLIVNFIFALIFRPELLILYSKKQTLMLQYKTFTKINKSTNLEHFPAFANKSVPKICRIC